MIFLIVRTFVFEALNYSNLAIRKIFSQYFDSLGYSPSEIGFLMAMFPILALISSPFWFGVASKIPEKKTYLIISLSSSILLWPIFFSNNFITSLLFVGVFSFFFSSCIPLGDSLMAKSVIRNGGTYNRIRLFGTIGYSATSLIVSQLIKNGFDFLFVIGSLLFLSASVVISIKENKSEKTANKNKESIIRNGNKFTFILMLSGFFYGMIMVSFHSTFLPILTREMNFGKDAVGMALAFMAIAEVPFLLFANKIVDKLGNVRVFLIGCFLSGLRNILVTYANSLPSLILFELFHGIAFILMYYSLFNYIHFKLSEKYTRSAQSLFWFISIGLSYIVSSIFGGFLIEWITVKESFRVSGYFGFIVTLIIFVIAVLNRERTGLLKINNYKKK